MTDTNSPDESHITAAELAGLRADLTGRQCPECHVTGSLCLGVMELVAKPTASHSLAGMQMKVSALQMLVLSCRRCPMKAAAAIPAMATAADPPPAT